MASQYYYGTGRRKTATARVRLYPGQSGFVVNGKPMNEFFSRDVDIDTALEPLRMTGNDANFLVSVIVAGGGVSGQAGAVRHGISRAIVNMDSDLRSRLKKEGFLTRDPREKERKKYGQKGARKRFQFSKR